MIVSYYNKEKDMKNQFKKYAQIASNFILRRDTLEKYIEMAKQGTLPPDFDQWELAGENGWTVAHSAAEYGHLPKAFDRWNLAVCNGWTVAHEAARKGTLPDDFNQWDLRDEGGRTVAHTAARYGHLPSDFNQWELADGQGRTIFDMAGEQHERWKIEHSMPLPNITKEEEARLTTDCQLL
jgi:hypothetical protein